MKRPSKKEIAERIRELKQPKEGEAHFEQQVQKPEGKKTTERKIRRKAV